jgi:hypothetical protein
MDYQISTDEAGAALAQCPGLPSLAVMPDGPSRIFMRRGIKLLPNGEQQRINWVVGELRGVRVYFDGASLVMTTQDINI